MRQQGTKEASTRSKVVAATLACILDKGFYRASSNEIARYAGVSWGVIQYHFGSRENLLVAVHREHTGTLAALVENADVSGATVEERLLKYWELLRSYYGRPEYLAYLQIALNLSRDPAVSDEGAATIEEANARLHACFLALEEQTLGAEPGPPHAFLFHTLRGLALSHLVSDGTLPATLRADRDPALADERARYLVSLIARAAEPGADG